MFNNMYWIGVEIQINPKDWKFFLDKREYDDFAIRTLALGPVWMTFNVVYNDGFQDER